jgi:type II secretory pathway pseudopilin PulG
MIVKNSNGISLVEIVIALTISALLAGILVKIFTNSSGTINKEATKVEQGISSNEAITQISEAIRLASQVANSFPNTSPQFTTGSDTLILQVPALDTTGTVKENTYDYFIFAPDSANPKILRKKVFPDPASTRKSENQVLVTNLNQIIFSYLDRNKAPVAPSAASTISFSVLQLSNTGLQNTQSSQSAQVSLRNL